MMKWKRKKKEEEEGGGRGEERRAEREPVGCNLLIIFETLTKTKQKILSTPFN